MECWEFLMQCSRLKSALRACNWSFIDQKRALDMRSGSIRPPEGKRKPGDNIAEWLKLFDAMWHARAIVCLPSGQMVRIYAGDWGSAGRNVTRKESDMGKSRMRGGYREWRFFVMFVFLLLVWEYCEGKGGMRGREWACVATDRRIGGWLYRLIYTPVFTTS